MCDIAKTDAKGLKVVPIWSSGAMIRLNWERAQNTYYSTKFIKKNILQFTEKIYLTNHLMWYIIYVPSLCVHIISEILGQTKLWNHEFKEQRTKIIFATQKQIFSNKIFRFTKYMNIPVLNQHAVILVWTNI